MTSSNKTTGFFTDLLYGLLLTAVCYFAATYSTRFLADATDNAYTRQKIGTIAAAPILEETSKYIAVRRRFALGYFIAFNIWEFCVHTNRMVEQGAIFDAAFRARFQVVILHGILMGIHLIFRNSAPKFGWLTATALHMLNNYYSMR